MPPTLRRRQLRTLLLGVLLCAALTACGGGTGGGGAPTGESGSEPLPPSGICLVWGSGTWGNDWCSAK